MKLWLTLHPAGNSTGLHEVAAQTPLAPVVMNATATEKRGILDTSVTQPSLGAQTASMPWGNVSRASPSPRSGQRGHGERHQERLLERGEVSLHDSELLEMLLSFVQPKSDTELLAEALIGRFGSFANVLAAPKEALLCTVGLDRRSVAALKLVPEAALRMIRAEVMEQQVLDRWDRLMDYLNAVMAREKIEQFRILFLDSKNRLLADEAQARGTVNHTPVYPREVVKRALELHATALILVHNHPSGDPSPSKEDIAMTREVREAAAVLGIALHDHVIVGNGRWVSFRMERLL